MNQCECQLLILLDVELRPFGRLRRRRISTKVNDVLLLRIVPLYIYKSITLYDQTPIFVLFPLLRLVFYFYETEIESCNADKKVPKFYDQ